jgi:hypothetical protein
VYVVMPIHFEGISALQRVGRFFRILLLFTF